MRLHPRDRGQHDDAAGDLGRGQRLVVHAPGDRPSGRGQALKKGRKVPKLSFKRGR